MTAEHEKSSKPGLIHRGLGTIGNKKSATKKIVSALVPDWKKQAAMASAGPSDQSGGPSEATVSEDSDRAALEQSFLDQAYQRVANVAGPLMKPGYRVGFEIVQTNDDHTRLVGVFLFRVRKSILMVPVFYANGVINGANAVYRHTEKKFVPLDAQWADFLVGQAESGSEGQGVPMSMRQQAHDQLHLERLAAPPLSYAGAPYKFASTDESKALIKEALPDMIKAGVELAKSASAPSILRQFIQEDGGTHTIKLIANSAKQDFKFANAIFVASDPEHYMPEVTHIPKQAAADEVPVLILHTQLLDNPHVKQASEKDLANGYSIEDKRYEEATNEHIITEEPKEMQSVGEPGIYDIMLSDGATHEMLVAYQEPCDFVGIPHAPQEMISEPYLVGAGYKNKVVHLTAVDMSDKQSVSIPEQHDMRPPGCTTPKLPDKLLGTFQKNIPVDIGEESPKAGKAYRIYCAEHKSLSGPFLVEKITKDELGLKKVFVRSYIDESNIPMILNPDFENCDFRAKVIGRCCRFVEVAFEKKECDYAPDHKAIMFKDGINLAEKYAMDQFVFEQGYKKASVRRVGLGYLFKSKPNDPYAGEMNKLACKCHLMGCCFLKEAAADEVLRLVDESKINALDFLYHEKKGYNLRFNQFPVFPEQMNSEFGVNEQPEPSRYLVTSERDIPVLPKQRIGDRYSQETQDTIDQMQPMELYAMSQEKGMPNLFEHGMVGSLVNTYDSAALIEKYIPALEEGLDRIGRILFLFYWKPEDFVKSFGSDDQDQLENKLVSNFKSFGALVLELMQKNQNRQSGSTGLS